MFAALLPFIKFVFTGNRRWEWLPIFVARFSLGLFFAVSGYHKLFNPVKHEDLIHLMGEIGMPFPEFMALFLAAVEFFGGILLMVGLFSTICAIALTIAMIVAIITVEIDAIIPKGIGFLDWMSWFLYLPQVMYVILFVWLMITGPGCLSLDYYLAKKYKLDEEGNGHSLNIIKLNYDKKIYDALKIVHINKLTVWRQFNAVNTSLLIDLDGVLYQGENVIPGSVETIQWIQAQSIPHVFITNTTSRPRSRIVDKLNHLGFKISADSILTPPIAACRWVTRNVSGPAALFVPDSTRKDFTGIPLLHDEDGTVSAVVLGDIAAAWTFEELNRAFRFLMQEPKPVLLALGMTRYWRTADGLQLDVGPYVKALEYAADCKAVVLGKPSAQFFETALNSIQCDSDGAIMIGDDIVGDIQGAQRAGIRGVLVRTGKFRAGDLGGDIHPHAVIDSIADLPAWWNQ